MKTPPIAFLIFNRPNATRQVFEVIRQAQPSKLLVVADGPRTDRFGEAESCETTRQIIEQVDWDCQILKNYSDINLGCKKRVSSGLDWVFENVESAIVLEEDCVPHPSFFQYCDELLSLYRYDTRVMSVCGLGVPDLHIRDNYSYSFSRYQRCWGWASWRRAWKHYDLDMALWPLVRESGILDDIFLNRRVASFWANKFQAVFEHNIDTWDYQWTFACWMQNGLNIIPSVNMIDNVGFGKNATHTTNAPATDKQLVQEMMFPLKHPPFMVRDNKLDSFIQRRRHSPYLLDRIEHKVRKIFHSQLFSQG